jgi:hypothetical protein
MRPRPPRRRRSAAAARRSWTAGLDGAETAGSRWAQVIDVEIIRKVTEVVLPGQLRALRGGHVRGAARDARRVSGLRAGAERRRGFADRVRQQRFRTRSESAKRHQAISGYWHSLTTLARWCRIRSYLDSAIADGITALNAIRDAIAGKPWLPPLPAIA